MNHELFVCKCSSVEHQLIVTKDNDYLYFQMHLAMLPWWSRVIRGVKYIFGHRSKYGDFEEIIFDANSAYELGATLISFGKGKHGTTGMGTTKHFTPRIEQQSDGV